MHTLWTFSNGVTVAHSPPRVKGSPVSRCPGTLNILGISDIVHCLNGPPTLDWVQSADSGHWVRISKTVGYLHCSHVSDVAIVGDTD